MYSGEKVTLGPLLPEDSAQMFQWSNDVELAHWNGPYRPVDWITHSNWFANIGKERRARKGIAPPQGLVEGRPNVL